MQKIKILYNKEFVNARLIFYLIILLEYNYFAYFSHFQCTGCPLCGMTRAVKSLLVFDFKSAFEFNNMVWIFCIILPIFFIDIVIIVKHKIIRTENKKGKNKIN